jgi:hypothetical protein
VSTDTPAQASLDGLDLAPAEEAQGPPERKNTQSLPRGPKGYFVKGNTHGHRFEKGNRERWVHGRKSRLLRAGQLPEQQALAVAIREQVELIVDELGGPDQVSTLKAALLEDWCRLGIYAATVEQHLEQGGLLTGKGRTKAAAAFWLSLLDRRHRVATQIGLQRIARKLPSLEQLASDIAARSTAATIPPASAPDASAVPEGAHDEELDLR